MSLECVYEVYCCFGGTHVVVGLVFHDFGAAVGAGVGIEPRVGVSETYFRFEVPVFVLSSHGSTLYKLGLLTFGMTPSTGSS